MLHGSAETAAVERVSLSPNSPWWGEHRSRYHFAAGFVSGRLVLDVACGTGFGGPILLRAGAAGVIAIDLAWDGLKDARREVILGYHLCQGDGTQLPLADKSIDVITSFETVEHTPQHSEFIAELRRVLKPDGVLIISTPNSLYTKPIDGKPRNPFHVREFDAKELRELLAVHFKSIELLGQRTHPRYRICPYWELAEYLPRDLKGRARVWAWKLQNRLPEGVKEGLSKMLWRRSFYPGEHDFIFAPEEVLKGYVLVAVCRP